MRTTVLNTIKQYKMCSGVTDVAVALSGGADSMALLFVMCEIKDELGVSVSALHLNHSLRDEADLDEQKAKEFCKSLDVPFLSEKRDVLSEKRRGESVETAARRIRYEFLENNAKGVIATAHTASDNLETVLFNISRGTGLKGLGGIPPVRGKIIRPLINVTRDMVEDYCEQNKIEYCTDKTNFEDTYSRNNIRLNAVPVLKKVNGAVEKNVANLSEILRMDYDFLAKCSKQTLEEIKTDDGLSAEKLAKLHPALGREVVKMFCEEKIGKSLEQSHIFEILNKCGANTATVNLPDGYFAKIKSNRLIVEKQKRKEKKNIDYTPDLGKQYGEYGEFSLTVINRAKFEEIVNFDKLRFSFFVDCDTIIGQPKMRNRIAGDKITLQKRKVTKTLKKLFNELKLDNRDELMVLADSKGVVFVEGIGADYRNRVSKNSSRILMIEKR